MKRYSANSEQQERIFELVDKERERRQKLRREREASGQLHGKVGDRRKKQVRGDHYKTRFRKTFESIRDEEEARLKREQKGDDEIVCYRTAAAPASIRPARKICAVCGDWGRYKCVVCGVSYCRIKCKVFFHHTFELKYKLKFRQRTKRHVVSGGTFDQVDLVVLSLYLYPMLPNHHPLSTTLITESKFQNAANGLA